MSDVKITEIKNSKGYRTHSEFLCREMFFEHIEGTIDENRRRSVELLIESSKDLKNEYQALLKGLKYAESLKQVKVDPAALAELSGQTSVLRSVLTKAHWRRWPASLRWSLQAVAVAGLTAITVSSIPWQELPVFTQLFSPQSIELAKVSGVATNTEAPSLDIANNQQQAIEETEPFAASNEEKSESGHGEHGGHGEVAVAAVETIANEESDEAQAEAQRKVEEEEEKGKAEATAAALEGEVKATAKPALKGFVYRSYPLMDNLDEKAPLIVKKIKELGGTKAGNVELGWRRKNSRYFHFSLPEKNYDELIAFLQTYAKVKVIKDSHRRVMPEGSIRFILWIEEIPEKSSAK